MSILDCINKSPSSPCISLSENYGNLNTLIELNNSDYLTKNENEGGYIYFGKYKCGITRMIDNKIINTNNNNNNNNNSTKRTHSGIQTGTRFHKYIYHELMCIGILDQCNCFHKFGTKTYPNKLKSTSKMKNWLDQAKEFIIRYNLKPIHCELMVCKRKLNFGTEIDMIAKNQNTNQLINISWKTGGNRSYKTKKYIIQSIRNTNCRLYHNQIDRAHIQQFIENRLLKLKGIYINKSLVVIFGNTISQDKPIVVNEPEWFKNENISNELWNYILNIDTNK